MVIVYLSGGLGNQLFQYATARALSLHHRVPLLLDISSFQRTELPELEVPRAFELYNFKGINEPIISADSLQNDPQFNFVKTRLIDKLLPRHKRGIYVEPHYHFDNNFFKAKKDVYLKGHWQTGKYFNRYRNELLNIIELKEDLINKVKDIASQLQNGPTVAVHVRRGDYLRKPIILEWHGVLGKEYYAASIEALAKYEPKCRVIYFTDDIEWVEKELLPIAPGEIFSNSVSHTSYEDFYLMSMCKHNIIANSTFSWWAAWLNKNPDKKVIAPKKWFDKAKANAKDVIPADWITI